jgi:predicted phosphoribosyltransferase
MLGNFLFNDRTHAGQVLSEHLLKYELVNPFILALPRGGVPVAHEISRILRVPMDVLIVRKIGAPFNPEYGIGAISENLIPFMNAEAFLPEDHIEQEVKEIIENEKTEVLRRIKLYRGERKLPDFKNLTILLVDDGLATGVTAAAAGKYLRLKEAKRIILAVPVGPRDISIFVRENMDEIICPYTPSGFSGISNWYRDFRQVTDDEVLNILYQTYPEQKKSPIDLSLFP